MPGMPIMDTKINQSFCPFASAVALVQKHDKTLYLMATQEAFARAP